MIDRTSLWLAAVMTVAGCAAQPKPSEPIGATAIASDVQPREQPAPPPASSGHERIHFEPNGVALPASEQAMLDSVLKRLRDDPALNLQISGHTDPSERNADDTGPGGPSRARAEAVRSYLLAHGIDGQRLLIRAVGSTEPRDTNATVAGRAVNRRVEFERATIKVSPFGGRVVVTDTEVEILDVVTFEPGKAVIMAKSYPTLDAIAATLRGNPSIQLVEVQSHTDERGDAGANLRLTEARARAVVAYLIGKGIDAARLVPQGYGGTQPLDASHNEAAWAKNNRMAFVVLKRAP